ncbi:transcriptional regulator [Litoribrevibacter albus]|uniref:Transcriptional regulator n=2 Tax=Litoribrevibacter albus TaxID=1473156 RepID=A0AA37W4E6_9GAMM|nr:transcriptional regulator [Litoribrevibacter albus]
MTPEDMQQHATEAASLLKKMANPNRLMILCSLSEGELSVGELNERVTLSQSALSQHLAGLRDADLVSTRREAQTIYYSLKGDYAMKIVSVLQEIFCPEG